MPDLSHFTHSPPDRPRQVSKSRDRSMSESQGSSSLSSSDKDSSLKSTETDPSLTELESKQPKTIKGILAALKEGGKVRESASPVRARIGVTTPGGKKPAMELSPEMSKPSSSSSSSSKSNEVAPVPVHGSVKGSSESTTMRRLQASPSLKHMVKAVFFYFKF